MITSSGPLRSLPLPTLWALNQWSGLGHLAPSTVRQLSDQTCRKVKSVRGVRAICGLVHRKKGMKSRLHFPPSELSA
jgi:hypothetical protein